MGGMRQGDGDALCSREATRPKTGQYVEACVDSGCGRSVMGARTVERLGYRTTASIQSARGHCFTGPGGEQYPNCGRVVLRALDEASKMCKASFNVAEGVDQILGSVADMNDAGNMVIFDEKGSMSLPGTSPEAATICRAMARATKATLIHHRRNNFYIPLWVQAPEAAKAPFTRRGK